MNQSYEKVKSLKTTTDNAITTQNSGVYFMLNCPLTLFHVSSIWFPVLKCYIHRTILSDREGINNKGHKTITVIKIRSFLWKTYALIFIMNLLIRTVQIRPISLRRKNTTFSYSFYHNIFQYIFTNSFKYPSDLSSHFQTLVLGCLRFFSFFLCTCLFFRSTPTAHGGSQARGSIRAIAASLHHSHSNTGSQPCLRPTPQPTATPDP